MFSASLVLVSFVNIYLDLYFSRTRILQLEKLYHISVVFLHYYVYYYYLLKETHTFDPDKRIKSEIESNTGTENKRNNNGNHLIILLNKISVTSAFAFINAQKPNKEPRMKG